MIFINTGIKSKTPNIFPRNDKANTLNNVIIFDLEPDDIISQIGNDTFIPAIREWSFIHIETMPFKDIASLVKFSYHNTENHYETIATFCKKYKELNYPTIIAHNGCMFDFLLLIAHIYRYMEDTDIIKKFTFYDTYLAIRAYKNRKGLKIKCGNLDLFIRYIDKYTQYKQLMNFQHQSLADAMMTALWFNTVYKYL